METGPRAFFLEMDLHHEEMACSLMPSLTVGKLQSPLGSWQRMAHTLRRFLWFASVVQTFERDSMPRLQAVSFWHKTARSAMQIDDVKSKERWRPRGFLLRHQNRDVASLMPSCELSFDSCSTVKQLLQPICNEAKHSLVPATGVDLIWQHQHPGQIRPGTVGRSVNASLNKRQTNS